MVLRAPWLLLALACAPRSDTGEPSDPVGDGDTDADTDSDTDADADTDADSDADADADTDTDADADTDTDTDSDTDSDTDTDTSTAMVPDFSLIDENPSSATAGQPVSPRDHLQRVSGWYFTHAS